MDLIGTQKESDDLGVVKVTFREERTQWAIRHAAGKNFLLSRAAFTLEVTTGESSGSRSALLVFHREGKPGLALTDFRL